MREQPALEITVQEMQEQPARRITVQEMREQLARRITVQEMQEQPARKITVRRKIMPQMTMRRSKLPVKKTIQIKQTKNNVIDIPLHL